MTAPLVGTLVMAYGSPRDRSEIRDYYTDIRRGRVPSEEEVGELVARYDAVGGPGALRAISEQQAAAVGSFLGSGYRIALGYKHAPPRIEEAHQSLMAAGASRVVGLVLAPHYSDASIGEYAARAPGARMISSWHLMPAYVDFLVDAVRDALAGMPRPTRVVFSAHSLPGHDAAYESQLRETAEVVAGRAALTEWCIGYQSAGRRGSPWMAPDVLELVDAAARDRLAGVVVCACGFVADHLEVRYDLDIVAAQRARAAGLVFARTRSVNADERVMRGLAELVVQHAA